MHHYKTNTIFATPIPGLDSKSILAAHTKNFEYLISKCYIPKVSIMDNQVTKVIKAYLKTKDVSLQLMEKHNHRVIAVECAIQSFKNRQAKRGFAKEASVYFLYLESILFCTVHYATLPFHHCAIPPSCHSAIPPFRHSAILPFHHSVIPPFRHSSIPPFHHSAILLQYAITRCMYHRRC
jgi:hypothetical protein